MGPRRSSGILTHSVLDRVAGVGDGEAASNRLAIGVEELRDAVRRDLEWLLNTRRSLDEEIASLEEVQTSHLGFGLPDLSVYSRSSARDSRTLRNLIRDAVIRFEPRLEASSVRVDFVENDDIDDFAMRFRIRGMLQVDPISEPVTFDTAVDPSNGTMSIEEAAE